MTAIRPRGTLTPLPSFILTAEEARRLNSLRGLRNRAIFWGRDWPEQKRLDFAGYLYDHGRLSDEVKS